MASERDQYYLKIMTSGNPDSNSTKKIGQKIKFYTENRCFRIKSPITTDDWPTSGSHPDYYVKSGTTYELIQNKTNFDANVRNNVNIYIEVGTHRINCPCGSDGKISLTFGNNDEREYVCPACKGKGYLIEAIGEDGNGCPVTGISVFLPETGPIQKKYRVTPPGSITSVLIAEEDILPS